MIAKIEIKKDLYIYVVQIAGLIARRIKCELEENQNVKIGERFGIIRFGSRVDLYLPKLLHKCSGRSNYDFRRNYCCRY